MYWVGSSKASFWLYREFRTVPDAGGVVASAVLAAMSQAPLDPDYSTPWRQPSRLEASTEGHAITIDVSPDALASTNVGSELAQLGVQQLVWTATAAAQSPGPVTILVNGAPADAWGVVRLGEPMTRDADARAPLWLDTPAEGAKLPAGKITFTGQANVFEGHVAWEITRLDRSHRRRRLRHRRDRRFHRVQVHCDPAAGYVGSRCTRPTSRMGSPRKVRGCSSRTGRSGWPDGSSGASPVPGYQAPSSPAVECGEAVGTLVPPRWDLRPWHRPESVNLIGSCSRSVH